jgi:hypothetical protein
MIMTISSYLFTFLDGVPIYLFLYILLFQLACKETKFILGYLFLYVNTIFMDFLTFCFEFICHLCLPLMFIISAKALELFLQDLCDRTYAITIGKGARTKISSHL